MDIEQSQNIDNSSGKIFADLSEVPLLPGHATYMVRSDAELDAKWEQLINSQTDMNAAHKALTERIVAFLEAHGLLDQVSGIAATNFNCVWLNCSLRAWHQLENGLKLTTWSNPEITLESNNTESEYRCHVLIRVHTLKTITNVEDKWEGIRMGLLRSAVQSLKGV